MTELVAALALLLKGIMLAVAGAVLVGLVLAVVSLLWLIAKQGKHR